MASPSTEAAVYVLRVEAVQWAIAQLTSRRIHPFFPAYLHLRSRAVEAGSDDDILPDWQNGLGPYLVVPGGPPRKPYFRPFWNRGNSRRSYWLNSNLAGSYAPRSLRLEPQLVIEVDGRHFSLKADHARSALDGLLYGQPVSVLALSAFYYRDFGFISESAVPEPEDLAEIFRRDFHFGGLTTASDDFYTLFDVNVPSVEFEWFERFSEESQGGG